MHTPVKRATAWLIFTLTLGLNACTYKEKEDFALKEYAPTSANAAIKQVSLGTSDTNKFDAQRVGTQFPAGTKKVLVWYRWEGANKDTKVDIVWWMGDTTLLKQGEALGKESGTAAWILQMGAGGDLPQGNYKVELLENGSIVTTIPFQIGSATPVTQAPSAPPLTTPTPVAQPTSTAAQDPVPAPPAPSTAIEQPPAPVVAQAPLPTPSNTAAAPVTLPTPAGLASADGEKAGVRVVVTELKRSSGDTVNLKFVLINDSDAKLNLYSHYLGDARVRSDYRSVGGVHLVDPTGKKKYLVVRDAEEKCLCSTDLSDSEPKTRANLWAKFPAPPAGVQKVSIVIPHFSPMDDVPISQ